MSTNQIKVPSLSWGRDNEELALLAYFNPFDSNAPFLYPLKTSENRKVF